MTEGDKYVSMLLDIDNYYGESEGRLGPIIKYLLVASAPALIWIYLSFPIRGTIFLPLWGVYAMYMALVIPGRQRERLAQYRKQLNDDYAAIHELFNIKTVHPDGCIEYVGGTVAYAIVASNGTTYDPVQRAQMIKEFISLLGDFSIDVYSQNLTETKSLDARYSNVKLFVDEDAAKDFLDIIDHNRQVVYSQSLLTRIVFVIKGRRSAWDTIRDNCHMAVHSGAAKAFKDVRVAKLTDIRSILDNDIRGAVDLEGILQRKYTTHQYFGSKVLYFDNKPVSQQTEVSNEERGFLIPDG